MCGALKQALSEAKTLLEGKAIKLSREQSELLMGKSKKEKSKYRETKKRSEQTPGAVDEI